MNATRCSLCGKPLPAQYANRRRCDNCRSALKGYTKYCRDIHKSSPARLLLDFRNMLLNLKYNTVPGAKLPNDLDYQLDRVNRYLAGDSD